MTAWKALASLDKHSLTSAPLDIDYLSHTTVRVLVSSAKNRHWAVACTTLGMLLLRLAAIMSTSLLEREARTVVYAADGLTTTSSFSRNVQIPKDPNFDIQQGG